MKNLRILHKLPGSLEFARWLDRCWGTSFNAGSQLVESITGSVTVADCDDMLRDAWRAGWIKRIKPYPSISQRCFGVASMSPETVKRGLDGTLEACLISDWGSYIPPTWWGWEPDYSSQAAKNWLDEMRLKIFTLNEGPPAKAGYIPTYCAGCNSLSLLASKHTCMDEA